MITLIFLYGEWNHSSMSYRMFCYIVNMIILSLYLSLISHIMLWVYIAMNFRGKNSWQLCKFHIFLYCLKGVGLSLVWVFCRSLEAKLYKMVWKFNNSLIYLWVSCGSQCGLCSNIMLAHTRSLLPGYVYPILYSFHLCARLVVENILNVVYLSVCSISW